MNPCRRLLASIAAAAFAGGALAQETSVSVSVGVTHSDNVGRTSANEESETMPEAGLQVTMTRDGRLDADLAVNLQYRTYADDAFDDELLGGVNAILNYDLVPDRFSWMMEDNFGQSLIDPQNIETPDNRQNFNYFSTGPTLRFPLGDRLTLSVSGLWSDVDYEESDFDSERLSGNVALHRAMSDTSALSINVSSQRVEFDESPPNSNYDLHSAFLGYEATGARTSLSLSGGVTSLRDFGENTDGPLADITVVRKVGARSTLTVNAGTRFYDSAESFRRDRGFDDVVLGEEDFVPSRDPFQQDYARISMTIQGQRTTLGLGVDGRKEDHEADVTLDRERIGASASLSRRVGPRLTASLVGSYGDESFDAGNVDFKEWSAGVALDWSLSPAVGLGLRAEHHDGSGDTSAGSGLRDYEENRYTLRITYSPGN